MIYDPNRFFGEDDRRSLSLAHLRLRNGLAKRTLARTPQQEVEAQAQVEQAQRELSSLYLGYLDGARKESQDALSLNEVLTALDTTDTTE